VKKESVKKEYFMFRKMVPVLLLYYVLLAMPGFSETTGYAGFVARNLLPGDLERVGEKTAGIAVDHVAPATPGEKSGLKTDDIIIEYGGTLVEDLETFNAARASLKAGQPVLIKVLRGRTPLVLTITLTTPPEDTAFEKALRNWDRNKEEAFATIQKLAEAGDAQSLHFLAKAYLGGHLLPENQDKGIKYLTEAAEKGWAVAQHSLGYFYQWGKSVKKDHVLAVKWYRQAAEQNHPGAMMNLCFLLAKGKNVPPDPKEAAKWQEKAARIGLGDAQFSYACILAEGKEVPKDNIEALKWFILAKDNFEPDDETIQTYGDRLRKVLEVSLTAQEKEEAQKRARNFIPRRVYEDFTQKTFKEQDILENQNSE
jgi:hypothetical protein